jgi:hypothetical protein
MTTPSPHNPPERYSVGEIVTSKRSGREYTVVEDKGKDYVLLCEPEWAHPQTFPRGVLKPLVDGATTIRDVFTVNFMSNGLTDTQKWPTHRASPATHRARPATPPARKLRETELIKIGMIITPSPAHREQDEMVVEWVGRNGNQVLVAGHCAKKLTVDGKGTPAPKYSYYCCFSYGSSFNIVEP